MFDNVFSSFNPNLQNYTLAKINKNDNSQKYVFANSATKPLSKIRLRENLSP